MGKVKMAQGSIHYWGTEGRDYIGTNGRILYIYIRGLRFITGYYEGWRFHLTFRNKGINTWR